MLMKKIFLMGVLSLSLSGAAMAQVMSLSLSVTAKVELGADSTNHNNLVVKEVVIDPQNTQVQAVRQEAAVAAASSGKSPVSRSRDVWDKGSKYANFGFVAQSLSGDLGFPLETEPLMSDMGFSLSMGKTWYLHRQPIADLVKIGLDWSWLDLNYVRFSAPGPSGIGSGQLEAAMQFGPSVTFNPAGRVKASVYGRVSPSYSVVAMDDSIFHHYVTFYNCGVSLAWRVLSFGLEFRQGGARYNVLNLEKTEDEEGTGPGIDPDLGTEQKLAIFPFQTTDSRRSLSAHSLRFYVGFRF